MKKIFLGVLHKLGVHQWTPFIFSRWHINYPGTDYPVYRIKVRHCLICNLHNEEKDE